MLPNEKGALVPSNDAEKLLDPLMVKGLKKKVQIIWVPVYGSDGEAKAIDSTNARWCHWVTIGNAVKNLYDLVDGFVICGGTDTMPHLTAAGQFMFPNIGKPVIASGAQLPMVELGDDGTGNLWGSILCAMSDLSGFHLFFGDELMHGLKVHKFKERRLNAFDCPPQWKLGDYAGDLSLYPVAPRRNSAITGRNLKFNPYFREGVKVIKLDPASASESILHDALDPMVQSLLIYTYGAGNARDEKIIEREKTHVECLRVLYDAEFPVVLGSPMMDGKVDSQYRSGMLPVSMDAEGGCAISGGDTTGPALSVKMMVVLAKSWDSEKGEVDAALFRDLMYQNMVGELTMKLS